MTEHVHRCGRCGLTSDVPEAFARVGARPGARRLLCPLCQQHRSRVLSWWFALLGALAPAVIFLVLLARDGHLELLWQAPPWVLSSIAELSVSWAAAILAAAPSVLVALVVILIAHEAGHALAAVVVGAAIVEISLGVGPVVLTATLGEVRVVLRLLPLTGHVRAVVGSGPGSRTRWLVILASGPAVHAAVVATTLIGGVPDAGVARDLFWVGGITLVLNLLPIRLAAGPPSDGQQLLKVLLGPSELDGPHPNVALALARATAHHLDGRLDEARVWCERALREHPDDTETAALLVAILVDSGRLDDGRQLALDLLDEDLPTIRRVVTLNNLAWADLLLDDADLAAEASAAVADACRSLPWEPAIMSTAGYAAIRDGRIEDGLALTARALRHVRQARPRASVLAVRAIGHARRGRFDDAEQELRQARRLAPDEPLTARAAEELERCRRLAAGPVPGDDTEGGLAPSHAPT